jgi:hypothetical protein
MGRTLKVLSIAILVLIIFALPASARFGIKINHATVDNTTLILKGINFDKWPTDVIIGGNLLTNCNILPDLIECSLEGTPVLENGGTWKVNVSAGIAPMKNDSIDVYIGTADSTECQPGDSFECYSGDMSTRGVGECHSGYRYCIGVFGVDVRERCFPLKKSVETS